MSKRTITLTSRPPVTIEEDEWPTVASASDKDWDNEYEFQANRTWKWWVKVRQHKDGRALVYAGYTYNTAFQNERDYSARRGVLLDADQDICEWIEHVCGDIAGAESDADHSGRWRTLAAECIADMPAETI